MSVVIYVVLAVSLVLESVSLAKALRQVHAEAREVHRETLDFVRRSPDPTVKTVASEDSAAVVGVLVALAGTVLHQVTGSEVWEGVASLLIAALLAYVAVVLGRDTKELLIGEAADPTLRLGAYALLADHPAVEAVRELLTMQLGPSSVLVVARVRFEDVGADSLAELCGELEAELTRRFSAVQQVFIDPSGASDTDAAELREHLQITVDEVRELDGADAVPAVLRSRTVRRAGAP